MLLKTKQADSFESSKSLVFPVVLYDWETWAYANAFSMALCQATASLMKLNQGLVPAQSVKTNSGYMDMWHAFRTLISFIGLFVYETTLSRRDKRDTHVIHD